ncbi:MAG: FlgD immunoglobulin-like domain containing protein, partial [bacterium]
FSYRFRPSFSDRPSKTGYNTKLIYRIIGSDIDNTYAEPDPFSPDCDGVDDETTIFFYMENEDTVSVFVFDANGTKMRTIAENLACKQGMNRLVWDGKDDSGNIVPDGDYEYRIKTIKTKTLSGTVKVLTLRRTKPYASPLQNPSSLGESNIYTISKSSSSRSIYRGEVVIYTIKIKSVGGTGFTGFVLYDIPDEGIYYIKGTSYLNGSKLDEPSFTGNKFIWAKNFNNPVDSAFIEYKAFVALDCPVGTRKNTAFAQVISTNGQYETDEVSSVITVIGGGFTKSSIIWGKVFEDKNGNRVQDDDEKGVKNACVTLDNGEKVITDEYGRFSFPYVKSANHIVLVNDASSSIGFEHASKTINISESGIYHLSIPVKPVGNKQNKAKTTMIFALNNKYDLDQKKLLSELRFYGERDFSSGWKLTISFDTSATGKEGFVDDYRLPAPNLGDNSMLQRRGKSNLIFSFAKGESYIKYGYGALGFNDGSELTAWNTTQEGLETLLRTRYLDIKAFAARAKS